MTEQCANQRLRRFTHVTIQGASSAFSLFRKHFKLGIFSFLPLGCWKKRYVVNTISVTQHILYDQHNLITNPKTLHFPRKSYAAVSNYFDSTKKANGVKKAVELL